MADKEQPMPKLDVPKKAAAAAVATGAVACAACCVLPLAIPAVVLAGTGSVLAWLVTGPALVVVAAAWVWIWRQSVRSRATPARSTLYMMGLATAVLALALLWPLVQPQIIRALAG